MNTKRADKIIDTKEWQQDSIGKLAGKVIEILIEDGATYDEACHYLEIEGF